ncbi:aldehyde dehydrogenase [Nitzschia inconspicua]|uniref:aldehyde dehydrogenase (NAD(+)) n=1 Tax=Nitzschia inconspicua TaxID=303405 RepID=A0A9K3LUE0_9STRA|nr:aldehyde dehydrogenase [Nitzschia inconspicua]
MLLRSLFLIPIISSINVLAVADSLATATVQADGTIQSHIDDDVQSKLIGSLPLNKFYINGKWVDPISGQPEFFELVDPSTAKVVAKVALGSPQDVNAAVLAAKEAWPSWNYDTSPKERQRLVKRLLEVYTTRMDDMAMLVSTEMGSPIEAALSSHVGGGRGNIWSALNMAKTDFEFERPLPNIYPNEGDEQLTTILYEAVGVVGMITPWNWPLNQITLKVIPALLVGCTAVLKPSEESPLSALLFAELMHEAGFPPGVFNLVSGDGPTTGDAVTRNPNVDMISFTGSTRAGKQVAANAAMNLKKTSLELGGKGANILFADVGDEWMAEAVVEGVESVFFNSGQSCNAPTRMFVERPYYDEAIGLAKSVAEETVVGSAHLPGDNHIGPVVNERQYNRIQQLIQTGIDEGATLVAGGLGRPDNLHDTAGFYVKPTVFADCTTNMTIMQEEIFGPVLCITPFDSEEEVLEMANDTPYGLTNYVQSRRLDRRRRMALRLRSGMVEMNDAYGNAGSPFGGVKGSGYGREGGVYGMEEFCIIKAITGYDVSNDDMEEE